MELDDVIAPDDGGRDAFERFRYQAHVAFPACLNCATGHGVEHVTCEHIEDLCVEEHERVRFTQIKTRNEDYGGWRLSDICGSSGALRSVLRTHRALHGVDEQRQVVYEVALEGFLKREDQITSLTEFGAATEAIARSVAKELRKHGPVTRAETRTMMARVLVRTKPRRETIEAGNLRVLGAAAPTVTAAELEAVYSRVIALICSAMEGKALAVQWPAALYAANGELADRVAGKRLTSEALREALAPVLEAAGPALAFITDEAELSASALERKLRLAGAPAELIEQAKMLRANASRREYELRAQELSLDLNRQLEDLDLRLLNAATTSLTLVGAVEEPAVPVFADLQQRLAAAPAAWDPRRLFHQDPLLLMGAACEISDECRFAWRLRG